MSKGQLVSVILTTRNEQDVIKRVLLSIVRQTYKNIEIILIDNNSKDRTCEIAKVYTKKVFNFGPERSAQRNFGAKQAKGEYLLFLDADMKLSKGVVKDCVKHIENNKRVGGIIIPEQSIATGLWEKIKAFERSFYNKEGDIISDAIRFFPKIVFEKIGEYDETITGPEDWDITDRIRKRGCIVVRVQSKIYHYERINSLVSLMEKKFYYGLDAHRYIKKHEISILGPKTIYFLSPVFYKNLNKIFAHPLLSLGMFVMLFCELLGGGMGYFVGRIRKL